MSPTVLLWEYYFIKSVVHSKSTGNYLNTGHKAQVATHRPPKNLLKPRAFVGLVRAVIFFAAWSLYETFWNIYLIECFPFVFLIKGS